MDIFFTFIGTAVACLGFFFTYSKNKEADFTKAGQRTAKVAELESRVLNLEEKYIYLSDKNDNNLSAIEKKIDTEISNLKDAISDLQKENSQSNLDNNKFLLEISEKLGKVIAKIEILEKKL